MVNWVFIVIVLFAIFLFFKITSFRYEKWWTYSIGILFIFMLFSFFNVVRSNEINLNTFEGFVSALKSYAYWIVGFGKPTASITGKASLLDWNVTNKSG